MKQTLKTNRNLLLIRKRQRQLKINFVLEMDFDQAKVQIANF